MGDQAGRLTALLACRYGASGAALHPIVVYEAGGGVYRVERRDGSPWVLRLFARDRAFERTQGDAAILAYVERYGVPAERLVPTLDGAGATEMEGQGVVVTRFVAGKRPDRNPATLRRLGEAVGRLHAVPPVPAGDPDPLLGRRAGAIPADDLPFGRACLARVAERVLPDDRAAYEAPRAALVATDDCEDLPTGLIHTDCHLDNAILTPDGETALIDWVGAGQGPRVAALGLLLYSCAVAAPGDARGSLVGLDPAQMRGAVEAVIDGYCRHHVLTPAELERLPDAVRFRPAVVAAREFATSIERGVTPNPAGWWTRYAEADVVAAIARTAMERYL